MSPLLTRVSNSQGITSLSGFRRAFIGRSGVGGYTITRSLRFNSADSAYLNRTPASAGNRKTWTWSGWVKLSKPSSTYDRFFGSETSASAVTTIRITQLSSYTDCLEFHHNDGTNVSNVTTNAKLRDPSAWYHIVVAVDTTQSTAANRTKIYLNGVEQSLSASTYLNQNVDTFINSTNAQNIGRSQQYGAYFNGYLADVHFLDGLTPGTTTDDSNGSVTGIPNAEYLTDFGEFDATTGVWNPKAYVASGPNNGTVWSNSASVTGGSAPTFANMFDGSLSTYAQTPNGYDIVWTPSTSIPFTSTVRVYQYTDYGYGQGSKWYVNGVEQSYTQSSAGWQTVTGVTSPITSMRWEARNNGGTYEWAQVYAIEVDGVVLIDGNTTNIGTNGFHLDFADNSSAAALGYDAAGSNDWTVNNIIANAASHTGKSIYFDGAGDRVTGSNSNLALGTGAFTVECYFKLDAGYDTQSTILGFGGGSVNPIFEFDQNKMRWQAGSTYGPALTANQWYHVAWVRDASSNAKIFLDGTLITPAFTDTSNFDGTSFAIGDRQSPVVPLKGWVHALRVVKGSAVYTSNFAPPATPLTAISGTQLLACQAATIIDESANSISLTAVGNAAINAALPPTGAEIDSLRDSPTNGDTANDTGLGGEVPGNYATLNPIAAGFGSNNQAATFSNGNLDWTTSSTFYYASVVSTIAPRTGKYYIEAVCQNASNGGLGFVSAASINSITGSYGLGAPSDGWHREATVVTNNNSNAVTGMSALAVGDIIGLALDLDNGKAWWSKNGTWHNSGNPANGTNATVTFTPGNKDWLIGCSMVSPSAAQSINFGQRAYNSTAPSGFKALCTANLPTPTIAKPSTVMDVVTYTGNGTSLTINGLGFSPDLVWIKGRDFNSHHRLYDQIRSATYSLRSSATDAEAVESQGLTAFTSDGFTLGSDPGHNNNGQAMVAWTWDENVSAGFDIVPFTATRSGSTWSGGDNVVSHSLGVKPGFIIWKSRTTSSAWECWHTSTGDNKVLYLNTTNAAVDAGSAYCVPTSSNFTLTGSSSGIIGDGVTADFIAYCFAPVAGYSSAFSFTGTGTDPGPFIYLGFKPKLILVKRTDNGNAASHWRLIDMTINPYNVADTLLYANSSAAELTEIYGEYDALSNGFRVMTDDSNQNASGGTYIGFAWAESPFAYSRAR